MWVVTHLLAAIVGGVIQYLVATYVWPHRHRTYTWVFRFRNHRAVGEPCPSDLVLDRLGYSAGYCFKRKTSVWVSYIISPFSIGVDVDRGDRFYPDEEVPEKYRVRPDDFRNSGYDKGHLVPSAAVDFSRRSNDETFAMSCVALQHPGLNRQAWRSLEGLVRKWTISMGKLAVVAGPLYGQRNQRVGDIPVPRRFFKVIYSYEHDRCLAFVFPNSDIRAAELWSHALNVRDLEQDTGYCFLARITEPERKKILDIEWWQQMAKKVPDDPPPETKKDPDASSAE
ncbi:MAG: DNA/RNA non-specific endonuclease [Myxococcales bacterium]|nr:DNA/RNA non-specific endonuclease [Myxococcales bacterium]